ncbi:hypothetical protein JTB14_010704 [Gonioctena quinquepunctata]|nr:hypothetical protein JTB14_010704 [Gonioctena quinquepunctata]
MFRSRAYCKKCFRKIVCNIGECRGRHNRLVHIDVERADKTNEHSEGGDRTEKNSEHSESGDFHSSGFVGNQYSALLKIVMVKLYGQENNIETYALLDEGSTVTLIDSSIAEILKLDGPTPPICLQWTNQMTQDEEYSKMVHLEIAGVESGKKFRLRNARTVKNLTLPKQKLDIDFICEKYDYIDRSVLEMIDNAEPKMLIGQDNIGLITCQKKIHPKFDQLATTEYTSPKKSLNLDSNKLERVLGLFWDTQEDYLSFNNKSERICPNLLDGKKKTSKREILQLVFDPIGFLSPLISTGRLIMQLCWAEKMDWDEMISDDIHRKWKKWIENLGKINSFKIPRQYFSFRSEEVQLHIFCDAGSRAFYSVAYVRSKLNDRIEVSMVSSKCKLGPLNKIVSIPRMELQVLSISMISTGGLIQK